MGLLIGHSHLKYDPCTPLAQSLASLWGEGCFVSLSLFVNDLCALTINTSSSCSFPFCVGHVTICERRNFRRAAPTYFTPQRRQERQKKHHTTFPVVAFTFHTSQVVQKNLLSMALVPSRLLVPGIQDGLNNFNHTRLGNPGLLSRPQV